MLNKDGFDVQLIGSTNNFVDVSLKDIEASVEDSLDRDRIIHEMQKFSQNCARVCYTEKDFNELLTEAPNQKLLERLINSGHHSVFEHINFNFNFRGLPKILAMVFNNEKQYATSEKSARYTQMSDVEEHQKELYDKWMGLLIPEIDRVYPEMRDSNAREANIKKLAQENARYMTSVFTATKMVHTVNWRQLNFLMNRFKGFAEGSEERNCSNEFAQRLIPYMELFNRMVSGLKVEGMDNQTDRHLSLFQPAVSENHFGESVYSTDYDISFAGLAQEHRHRTINYNINGGLELGADKGLFVPPILEGKDYLVSEWMKDVESVTAYDFPQAQLINVTERGMIEDFRSKTLLRNCGHAQWEIMDQTKKTSQEYGAFQDKYGENALKPKCLQGIKCPSACVWTGKKALERLV